MSNFPIPFDHLTAEACRLLLSRPLKWTPVGNTTDIEDRALYALTFCGLFESRFAVHVISQETGREIRFNAVCRGDFAALLHEEIQKHLDITLPTFGAYGAAYKRIAFRITAEGARVADEVSFVGKEWFILDARIPASVRLETIAVQSWQTSADGQNVAAAVAQASASVSVGDTVIQNHITVTPPQVAPQAPAPTASDSPNEEPAAGTPNAPARAKAGKRGAPCKNARAIAYARKCREQNKTWKEIVSGLKKTLDIEMTEDAIRIAVRRDDKKQKQTNANK